MLGLSTIALAIGWQFTRSRPGFEPILLAAIPIIIARIEGRQSTLRTRLDLWMVVFTATLLLGYWAAHNHVLAISRIWLILLGVIVFYNIANQPLSALWRYFDLGGLFGTLLASSFTASTLMRYAVSLFGDSSVGRLLIQLSSRLPQLQPNIAGGLLAMLLSLAIATLLISVRSKERTLIQLRGMMVALMTIGLLISSSRGAWLALAFGCMAGVAWGFNELQPGRFKSRWMASILVAVVLLVGGWILTNTSDQLPILIDSVVPGAASAQSRVELARNSVALLADTPFTGIGLGSFPGIYSRYILVISDFFYGYAHNLFIDIALAQSPLGLLAFVAIFVVAIDSVVRSNHPPTQGRDEILVMRAALLSAFLIVLVHGLIDDPLYSGRGAILLFFLPGLGVAVNTYLRQEHAGGNRPKDDPELQPTFTKYTGWMAALLSASLVILCLFNWRAISSVWRSNIAVLEQARAEMAQPIVFDVNTFPIDSEVEQSLLASIALAPNNRTAHHRMGLLAIRRGLYQEGTEYLEIAHSLDPDHPGIRKALGYAYTWLGDIDSATEAFKHFPEVSYELGLYADWWLTQGREDLADHAASVESRLISQ